MEDKTKEKLLLDYIPVFILLPLFGPAAIDTKNSNLETIEKGLKSLKDNAHIDGVMVDVWWGIVESKGPGKYNWDAYINLFKVIQSLELKVCAIMSFHKGISNSKIIGLPNWVVDVGKENPDIYYTNCKGIRNRDCLSLGVDNEPLFGVGNGIKRTPVEIYSDYMSNFKNAMKTFIESGVIVAIEVGLGVNGELCYPSFPTDQGWVCPGIGEFQCYDKYLKEEFKDAAEKEGHSDWKLPCEDAGEYNSKPEDTIFFRDKYKTDEGGFFLTWYSNKLIFHGDQILREANKIFKGLKVDLIARVSGVHWLYNHDSHAAELTAGYYNLYNRDGYSPIAHMLYKRNCFLNFGCLEMKNSDHPHIPSSAPHDLVKAVLTKAWREGIQVIGGNTCEIESREVFDQVQFNARPDGYYNKDKGPEFIKLHSFMYLRYSDRLFNNDCDKFIEFVRNMHADQVYSGDAEKCVHEAESESEITFEDILAATKPSGSFKWHHDTTS